jgi:hypothetical protein
MIATKPTNLTSFIKDECTNYNKHYQECLSSNDQGIRILDRNIKGNYLASFGIAGTRSLYSGSEDLFPVRNIQLRTEQRHL